MDYLFMGIYEHKFKLRTAVFSKKEKKMIEYLAGRQYVVGMEIAVTILSFCDKFLFLK